MTQELQELLREVIVQNEKGNDAFFNYSGHVDVVSVYVHNGSYANEDKLPVVSSTIHLSGLLKYDLTVKELIEFVKNVPVTEESLINMETKRNYLLTV